MDKHIETGFLPITLDNISFSVKQKTLLNSISLSINNKGISALIGPNGAGKTLLFKIISGLIQPSSGNIIVPNNQSYSDFINNISFVLQTPVIFRRSVENNLKLALKTKNISETLKLEKIEYYLNFGQLEHLRHSPARTLSGGEKQRLAIVRTLIEEPKLLLLDEPTNNLDPHSTKLIEDLIISFNKKNTKIFIITHDIGQAKRLANDIYFLHQGKLILHDKTKLFFENSQKNNIIDSYLTGKLCL